jgi:hypothetical protein
MYMLTIAFGGMGMAWKFGYKTNDAAKKAYDITMSGSDAVVFGPHGTNPAPGPILEIRDDFGQSGKFSPVSVTGVLLEDLDEAKLLHIEHALHSAKTQAAIQTRAQSDPTLKFMQGHTGPNGPAMISPMGRPMM